MTMTPQDHQLRCWFGALCAVSQARVDKGDLPSWLKEWKEDGFVVDELRNAGLGAIIEPEILGIMLALHTALGEAKPRPPGEIRKELKRLVDSVKKSWRPRLDRVLEDVESALLSGETIAWDESGRNPVAVQWNKDPLNDLRQALDSFVENAEQAEVQQLAPHGPGDRPEITTLALIVLVNTCRSHQPTIKESMLAKFAEAILSPVIEEKRAAGTEIAEPDWDDRIREIVQDHPPA